MVLNNIDWLTICNIYFYIKMYLEFIFLPKKTRGLKVLVSLKVKVLVCTYMVSDTTNCFR